MAKHQLDETWLLLDSRGIGGIETHVLQLAAALRSRWGAVRVVFYASYGDHPLHALLDAAGIPHATLGGSFRSLMKALSWRPRLLHTHGYKAGILGRVAAKLRSIPVVSTYHAGEPGQGRVRLYNLLDGLTAGLGEAIAVSAPIRDCITGSAHLIDNFVEVPEKATGGHLPVVAFVGRLSHEKGPDRFCRLAASLPHATFVVYGDGPMRSRLEKKYGGRVLFAGQVDSMAGHWNDMGLLCMPSRHEGLPYAALEAMAHGVPVAAFDVGSLSKVVGHGASGWIAPAGDMDAMAESLRCWEALDADEKAEMSSEARAAVEAKFSPDAVVPRIISVYMKALNERDGLQGTLSAGGEPC